MPMITFSITRKFPLAGWLLVYGDIYRSAEFFSIAISCQRHLAII